MSMTASCSLFLVSLMSEMWMLMEWVEHEAGRLLSVLSKGHTWEESSYWIG